MKKIVFIYSSIIAIVVLLFILFFTKKSSLSPTNAEKITIITTIFPLYDFTKNIGREKVIVKLLLPPGTEAHNYEPTPNDIIRINECDILIYTGKLLEPLVHNIISTIKNKKTIIVDTGARINLMQGCNCGNKKNNSSHAINNHGHDDAFDPHIWLDFDNAKNIVHTIAQALENLDPQNALFYKKNAIEYNEKLTKLDNSYREQLSIGKTNQVIHGGHYSFGYLAKKYKLQYTAAQGFSPNTEPTASDLITLIEQINKNDIKYIFYEELENPKIAEILAKETTTELLLLNSAHNLSKKDYENGITYISLMENNLKNLSIGLDCKN